MINQISIKGAKQHNLKNVSLDIPKEKLIVFTGVSGSGKSSLAFDTIYAEGQRRYVESLSSYARQFLGIMDKPDVESITGLSPSISIDQKSTSHNPRSTVGTVTEIYDYLRLLFARIGHPHCSNCGREIERQTSDQIVSKIISQASDELNQNHNKFARLLIMSPVIRDRKGEFSSLFANVRSKGYKEIRVDNVFYGLDDDLVLIKTNKHSIDVVIDKITLDRKTLEFIQSGKSKINGEDLVKKRISDAIEQALLLSQGVVIVSVVHDSGFDFPIKPQELTDTIYSEKFSCPVCNINIADIEPRSFSFNSPHGACPICSGIGTILTVDPDLALAPELSISEGGIIPFAKMFNNDTWFARVIMTVCQTNNIDVKKPIKLLKPSEIDLLFKGTGDNVYHVEGTNRFGDQTHISEPFRGINLELKTRYTETQSEFVRAEIEKFMRDEICSSCQGKRLKKESLTITILDYSIADITSMNISNAINWSLNLKSNSTLSLQESTIASPIVKELIGRLGFLSDVGLEYLTLDRSATTLSGGESQRIRLASQIGSGLSGVLYVLDEP
jgi:excinuclease ABC subunit A